MVKLTKSGILRINFRNSPTNEIILKCNFGCSYCIIKYMMMKNHDFNKKDFLQSKNIWSKLAEIDDNLYVRIVFNGELLINKWARECAFNISSLPNVKILEIVTNNSVNPKHYLNGFNLKKTSFNCSFHPEYMPIQRFLKNVIILKKAGCHVYANMVCIPQLVRFIPKIMKLFQKHDIILKLQALQTPNIKYLGKKYPNGYNTEERMILKKYFINFEEYEYLIDLKSTKGLMCYAGVDMIDLFLDGTIRRCYTGQICDYHINGPIKNNIRGDFWNLIPSKLRGKMNALTKNSPMQYISRRINHYLREDTKIDDLISGKVRLQNEPYPCHENTCACTAHLIGLKHIREKYSISENFAGLYNLN